MNVKGFSNRAVAGLLLIPLALSVMAPIAEANNGRGRRYKGGDECGWSAPSWNRGHGGYQGARYRGGHAAPRGRNVVVVRGSSAGPVLAGLIGGIALGATLAHASQRDECRPRSYEPVYSYYDPYCRESFATFDACAYHERACGHARVIRMVNSSTGQCVHSYCYHPGGWVQEGYQADDGYHGNDGYEGYDDGQ